MKKLLIISSIILLAAGCSRFGLGKPSGPPVAQITQYTGKLDKVKQTVDENGQQISGTFTVADGQDALTMLRSFRTITVKNFAGIGDMVTGIDGITPDSKHFWAFYVNGKSSNVGAGSYKVQDGDALEWKLDVISSGK